MLRKIVMIGIVLTVVVTIPIETDAERTELFQRFYSPKLALQTEKWTFSNDVLWTGKEAKQDSIRVTERPEAGVGTYVLEFFGATVQEAVGVILGGCLGGCLFPVAAGDRINIMDPPPESMLLGMEVGMAVGAPVGAACGATIVGKDLIQKGSFWGALAGSVIGELLPLYIGGKLNNPYLSWALPVTISLGAVI